jgi:hypothetical protein
MDKLFNQGQVIVTAALTARLAEYSLQSQLQLISMARPTEEIVAMAEYFFVPAWIITRDYPQRR